jgi:hypothetical protein
MNKPTNKIYFLDNKQLNTTDGYALEKLALQLDQLGVERKAILYYEELECWCIRTIIDQETSYTTKHPDCPYHNKVTPGGNPIS